MRWRFIILAACLVSGKSLQAQVSWRIEQIGVEQGLSEGNIYVIHQDRKGFIWIGTHGGLNRYDGYGFRVFQYTPYNSSTLGDNAVFFLKEDQTSGKFWIGGSSCLNEFDPETFVNKRYRYHTKHLEFADGVFVSSNEILLACEHDVLLFNTKTKTFDEVPVFDKGQRVSITRVENAIADRDGRALIMSKTGIFFYDPQTRTCKRRIPGAPDLSAFDQHEVFNVLHDANGFYWIATNKKGLIRFNPHTGQSSTVPLPRSLDLESVRFDVVIEDSRKNIWAGSSQGLFRVDAKTLASEYFSAQYDPRVALSHPEVNVITEDRNHFLWIGTVGGGINKMIPRNPGFKNYDLSRGSSGSRTGSYIMALQELNNNIWFSNIWDQIGRINTGTGRVHLLDKPALPVDYSWFSEGTIVTTAHGLKVLNGEMEIKISAAGETFRIESQNAPGLSYSHQTKTGKTYQFVKAPVAKSFHRNDTVYGNQFFYDAVEDSAGNIWIGSSKGLIRFDPSRESLVHFEHDDNNKNSISSNLIYGLEIDNQNEHVWMAAYNGGLCSYNMQSGTFTHYDKEDGLADNIVYSIEKDHHGTFWFSTNAGISAFNPTTKAFRNYGVSDGLLNHEFNRRASFKNNKGWIFFGGIFGVDYFHSDSIIRYNIAANLAFTGFRIFNRDYIPEKKEPHPVISLKPGDRYLTVEFASLDYNDQQKIQYAYRINNTEWITTGNQHALSFSDLATGEHSLHVRSTNSEGVWLDNEIACVIVVHPWWWQTWWFRSILALLAVAIMIAAVRLYYRRKLEKQKIQLEKRQAVEKERTRIATDIHDDLGSGLSRIRYLGETIRHKKLKEESIDSHIEKISHFSDEMVDKMNEIIWALNEKNDSLEAMISYIRSFAVEYMNENNVECHISVPEDIPDRTVNGETRRNIFLSVKECLHNIIKHAGATEAFIDIEVGRQLVIKIRDNGKGISWDKVRPFSNGLSNIKKRMNEVLGEAEFRSDKGTTVTLSAPLV